jgi:hypothetical protein
MHSGCGHRRPARVRLETSAPKTKLEKPISSCRRWISSAAAPGSSARIASESAARSAAEAYREVA